jgi:hypothetical protein
MSPRCAGCSYFLAIGAIYLRSAVTDLDLGEFRKEGREMPGQSAKGNPASARMSSTSKKDLRTKSWARGEVRKQERNRRQQEAHKRNLASGTTPWLQAQAARYKRRAAKREDWLKRQGDQLSA